MKFAGPLPTRTVDGVFVETIDSGGNQPVLELMLSEMCEGRLYWDIPCRVLPYSMKGHI